MNKRIGIIYTMANFSFRHINTMANKTKGVVLGDETNGRPKDIGNDASYHLNGEFSS